MNKGRISRRGALLAAAFMVFATPAFASLVVQNYMQADITVANACFVKVAGDDITSYAATANADDPLSTFSANPLSDTITVDGTDLLEEQLTIRGMKGDRVTYTDVVRYQNNCNVALDVTLVASTATATGDWADRSARIYISEASHVIGSADATFTGFPGAASSGWNATPIVVEAGGAIPALNAQTGTVTVDPNDEIYGAISVAAGVNATTTGTGTVNWVAQAVNAN